MEKKKKTTDKTLEGCLAAVMYQAIFKQEHAHEDGIWSCAWKKNEATGNDVIVTGSVDDTVKVWKWVEEEKLILQHSLEVNRQILPSFSTSMPLPLQ